ncbi:hypothetical protein MRB53_041094 [Persea americana]|nr:hypothetical protein MRB53_041094 [Persea americana]
MKKSTREKEALQEMEEQEGSEEEQSEQQNTPAPQPDAFGLPQRPAFAQQQARALHTSSRRALAVPTAPLDTTTDQDLPGSVRKFRWCD